MIRKLLDTDEERCALVQYLNDVDTDFEIPLSRKTNLDAYAMKLLKYGNVYASYKGLEIEAIIGFYCNDLQSKTAVISILSTKKETRGKGIAKALVEEAISVCKKFQMKCFVVDSVNPVAIRLYRSFGFVQYKASFVDSNKKEYLSLDL